MKIAVLIKQVPGTESKLSINDKNKWINESTTTFVMNPPDSFALEEALLIKEKINSVEVVVVSMGPARSQKVIREALARGADRGIHIQEHDNFEKDPLSIGKVFASVLKNEKFDLIFTGLQSDDTGMGQTGILIGEILNMSTATLVVETDCTESNIKVKRELESGWFQWLTMPLPASVSIQSGLNIPRYPSLKGIMGAKKKKINTINYAEIVNSSQTQRIESVSVPATSKQTEYIEGDSDEIASRLAAILKKEIKVV